MGMDLVHIRPKKSQDSWTSWIFVSTAVIIIRTAGISSSHLMMPRPISTRGALHDFRKTVKEVPGGFLPL
jgi:hypothetical protein